MALFPPRRSLFAEERQALQMLAGFSDGCSQSIMMAHGLPIGVLHDIVRSGLAVESRKVMQTGRRPVVVTKLSITIAGREALAGK